MGACNSKGFGKNFTLAHGYMSTVTVPHSAMMDQYYNTIKYFNCKTKINSVAPKWSSSYSKEHHYFSVYIGSNGVPYRLIKYPAAFQVLLSLHKM